MINYPNRRIYKLSLHIFKNCAKSREINKLIRLYHVSIQQLTLRVQESLYCDV